MEKIEEIKEWISLKRNPFFFKKVYLETNCLICLI